jgi:K+-transporting ATPase ATPase B chain
MRKQIIKQTLVGAFKKLNPLSLASNPVMFLVLLGSILTTIHLLWAVCTRNMDNFGFHVQICLWLWFTNLFANISESLAEGRGKSQAQALRQAKTETQATKLKTDGSTIIVAASELRKGDHIRVEARQPIPADGTVIEGIASVDESAITGESAPVIREAGGDRSAVTGGTFVLSDGITIEVTKNPGESFLDKMILLVEGSARQKTPNEIAFNIEIPTLIALFVCLSPTTIGALLSAIGIAGMNRLLKKNVLAMSGKAVEASGDVDVLILDKTGTITLGNRMASAFIPLPGAEMNTLIQAAAMASAFDQTPEGRSIVTLAQNRIPGFELKVSPEAVPVAFSAETRMSGIDLPKSQIRKGAESAICAFCGIKTLEGFSKELHQAVNAIGQQGGTPLLVCVNKAIIGAIHLKDIVKPGITDRFIRIRAMGIKTIMITGDNPLTAAAIAKDAGVDEFVADAKPENKLHVIRTYQKNGHMTAMSGDGTNDAPALAQSDVGLVMNTGTQAAREAGNMIDLDSDPTKIIEIVEIGKQLLITRGALTTFSIANDVAKYFAILPAMFSGGILGMSSLNVLKLASPQSAILSAVIFNALIIIAVLPLALKGVHFKPRTASQMLQINILIYGLGGVIAPFIGIKLIDMLLGIL